MSTVVKQFNYTGTLQVAAIPIGVDTIDLYLWGGGGGIGGSDEAGAGSNGAAGHFVSKTALDMTTYAGKKNIVVSVGGGGANGNTGNTAEGGRNGRSMTGYSGGRGGKSGTSGSSGAGGGGGGATLITLYEDGQSLNNIELAIAGGGGGSGGTGYSSRGGVGMNPNSATANSPDSLGEEGANHGADGGGGGAGGGGANGGKGGRGAIGDAGGTGGYSGSNLVPSGGSENNGSNYAPGGTTTMVTIDGVSTNVYEGRIAEGGSSVLSPVGGDGKAVIVFNIPAEARTKVSGTWKAIPSMWTKVSGAWKKVVGGYTKVAGTWYALFSSDIVFVEYGTGFGDEQGSTTSGDAGVQGTPTVTNIPATAPALGGGAGGASGEASSAEVINSPPIRDHHGNFQPAVPKQNWHPNPKYGKSTVPAVTEPSEGGGNAGKGIVCTTMYQTTGLEDWKRAMAIWRLYHKKVLGDERGVQAGYHWMFKPYVKGMRRNKVLKFIGAWLARHVTNDMKNKLYKRGIDKTDAPFKHNFRKTDIVGKIILAISEPTLRAVGRVLKMLNMDRGEQ